MSSQVFQTISLIAQGVITIGFAGITILLLIAGIAIISMGTLAKNKKEEDNK